MSDSYKFEPNDIILTKGKNEFYDTHPYLKSKKKVRNRMIKRRKASRS